MVLKRRDFIKIGALGAATGLIPASTKGTEENYPDDTKTMGVLVDTTVCIGCRKCELACNNEHSLTKKDTRDFEDKSVFKKHRRPNRDAYNVVNQFQDPKNPNRAYWMKVQCMHCQVPACASACLVRALEKSPKGPVTYKASRCIGCRYCMIACPFQIPAYEYDDALTPRVRKCTFCYERVFENGKKPACVDACPEEVFTFAPRSELINLAYRKIKSNPELYFDHVYGEFEAGGTLWIYLAPTDFRNTELPKLNTKPTPELAESIQHGIFKYFIPPVALYGLLGLIMHSFRDRKNKPEFK
jgi:formate dehydrogenase iron-sulfur subunit